jgi:hypothetical protein
MRRLVRSLASGMQQLFGLAERVRATAHVLLVWCVTCHMRRLVSGAQHAPSRSLCDSFIQLCVRAAPARATAFKIRQRGRAGCNRLSFCHKRRKRKVIRARVVQPAALCARSRPPAPRRFDGFCEQTLASALLEFVKLQVVALVC